jgi:hypothetical protein
MGGKTRVTQRGLYPCADLDHGAIIPHTLIDISIWIVLSFVHGYQQPLSLLISADWRAKRAMTCSRIEYVDSIARAL